jgi:hypothetical protein
MGDTFQRLLTMSEARPLSMNAQAALGSVRVPQRSQLSHLIRHFLERFFNHETASPDGDAKTRLVQLAFAAGVPGLIVAVYLWPVYHPIKGWPPGQPLSGNLPTYWLQVNHHFFFVLYSFVVMGIVTVFEWDMFFPDLLDMWVLNTLPIKELRVFGARIAAVSIFLLGFLFDANILAILVLPAAIDPANLGRFLLAHALSVFGSGLFAAVLILAAQSVLLSIFGERLFRKFSLLIQGLTITALLLLLLLFPVFSGAVPVLAKSGGFFARFCPPFWFLGLYQSILEGDAAPSSFTSLAHIATTALSAALLLAVLAYPIAYLRRVRQLIEGPGARSSSLSIIRPLHALLHSTVIRAPLARSVFHFITQTLLRVPRYRIYLVLYGGVGLSVLLASLLRFQVVRGSVLLRFSEDGLRASLAITVFWTTAGLRMSFISAGNRLGNWTFRIVHGRPPELNVSLVQLRATKMWAFLSSVALMLIVAFALRFVSPPDLLTTSEFATHFCVGFALCLLLTDALFLNVTSPAFTSEPMREQSNLALTVLKYFTFFPAVIALPGFVEPWIQQSFLHGLVAVVSVIAAHLALRTKHREIVRQHSNMLALEDDEEDFPMKLGLRY